MVTFAIYSDPARRLTYTLRLRVDKRRRLILETGKNLLIKSRWRWGKKRYNIRLEPVFRLDAEACTLIGVFCLPEDISELPWRFIC